MTLQTKTYLVHLALWLAAIVVIAWPLHLARPQIGDLPYIAGAAAVLGVSYLLTRRISRRMVAAQGRHD